MPTGWLLSVALLLAVPAAGQTRLVNVYHVENSDGNVSIVAENKGVAVVTVYLSAELVNMTSQPALPAKIALFPTQGPQVLATLTRSYDGAFCYQYHAPAYQGLYTSYRTDTTTAVYQFPFGPGTPWSWGLFDKKTGRMQFGQHRYAFALPDQTLVRAARPGIVVNIRQDQRSNSARTANGLEILHDDGTYATYVNIAYHSVRVTLGQRVGTGDELAEYNSSKQQLPLWFYVQRLGEKGPEHTPIRFAKASLVAPR